MPGSRSGSGNNFDQNGGTRGPMNVATDLPPGATDSETQSDLKSRLIDFSRELGFDSCRVAACDPPPHVGEFQTWLKSGAHGEMQYMARGEEKRSDPQKILAGAKSIIVLALNYFQGVEAGANEGAAGTAATTATGRIARYAWGDDYHDVIVRKLEKIDTFLQNLGGKQKCY